MKVFSDELQKQLAKPTALYIQSICTVMFLAICGLLPASVPLWRILAGILSAIGLLLLSVSLLSWFTYRKHPSVRHLERRRALYWAKGDPTPFCPLCYQIDRKQYYLAVVQKPFLQQAFQQVMQEAKIYERYDCPVCFRYFEAHSGMDFQPVETTESKNLATKKGKS